MTPDEQAAWLTAYGPKQQAVPATREQPQQVQPIVVQMPEVDARTFTTVEAPAAPAPAQIHNHVATPDVRVNVEPPQVTVEPAQVRIDAPITVEQPQSEPVTTRKTIIRDDSGAVIGIEETR